MSSSIAGMMIHNEKRRGHLRWDLRYIVEIDTQLPTCLPISYAQEPFASANLFTKPNQTKLKRNKIANRKCVKIMQDIPKRPNQ